MPTIARTVVLCLLLAVFIVPWGDRVEVLAQSSGVPTIVPGYGSTVEAWWATHPYNPAAAGYRAPGTITSPTTVINAAAPNLQAAVDACPATGCQIKLVAGATYGGANIVGKHHLHIVGQSGSVIAGQIWMAGCQQGIDDYGALAVGVRWRDAWAIDCITTGRASDIYIRDVTMDGHGQDNVLIHARATQDLLVDRVTFRNTAVTGGHPAQVVAGVWTDNIAVRASAFTGQANWAVYVDGCHGCVFVGNDSRQLDPPSGVYLALTNDDFSGDIDGNGTVDSNAENRMSQYLVYAGNTLGPPGPGRTAFQHQAQHLLISGNTVNGDVGNFSHSNARSPIQAYPRSYDYWDIIVRANTVTGAAGDLATFAADPAAIQDCQRAGRTAATCMKLGKYTVADNRVGTSVSRWGVEAGDATWAPVFDPRVITNNAIASTPAAATPTKTPAPATATPTRAPAVGATATPAPAGAMKHAIFDDANRHTAASFEAFVRDAKTRGFTGVVMVNGSLAGNDAMLARADAVGGMRVWIGAMDEQNAYIGSGTADITSARAVAYPIADTFKAHASFGGYYIRDEPSAADGPKVRLLAQAFRERDPNHDRFAVLNDNATDVAANWSSDMTILAISIYPADTPDKPECQFDNLFTVYPAAQRARTSQTVPLLIVTQAHGGAFNLRYPTLQELRGQARLAQDDSRAAMIAWFAYTSQQGWQGLKDSPDRLTEAERIAKGTQTGPSCDGGAPPTPTTVPPTNTPVPPTPTRTPTNTPTSTPTPTPVCIRHLYLDGTDTGLRVQAARSECGA